MRAWCLSSCLLGHTSCPNADGRTAAGLAAREDDIDEEKRGTWNGTPVLTWEARDPSLGDPTVPGALEPIASELDSDSRPGDVDCRCSPSLAIGAPDQSNSDTRRHLLALVCQPQTRLAAAHDLEHTEPIMQIVSKNGSHNPGPKTGCHTSPGPPSQAKAHILSGHWKEPFPQFWSWSPFHWNRPDPHMMAKHMNCMHQLHPRDDPWFFLVSRTLFTTTRKRTSSPSPASTESRNPTRAAVQHRWRQRASQKAVNRLLG